MCIVGKTDKEEAQESNAATPMSQDEVKEVNTLMGPDLDPMDKSSETKGKAWFNPARGAIGPEGQVVSAKGKVWFNPVRGAIGPKGWVVSDQGQGMVQPSQRSYRSRGMGCLRPRARHGSTQSEEL